jgi:hypothetical protein
LSHNGTTSKTLWTICSPRALACLSATVATSSEGSSSLFFFCFLTQEPLASRLGFSITNHTTSWQSTNSCPNTPLLCRQPAFGCSISFPANPCTMVRFFQGNTIELGFAIVSDCSHFEGSCHRRCSIFERAAWSPIAKLLRTSCPRGPHFGRIGESFLAHHSTCIPSLLYSCNLMRRVSLTDQCVWLIYHFNPSESLTLSS